MTDARLFVSADDPLSGGLRHTFDHPLARPVGTLLCFDFADTRTINAVPTGTLSSGATFVNLGDAGTPNAVTGATSTNNISRAAGSLDQTAGTTGGSQSISVGAAGLYNRSFDFHLHAVITVPNDAGNAAYAYQPILSCAVSPSSGLIYLDSGSNGRAPSVKVKSANAETFTGFTLGVAQILDICAVGGTAYVFRNGVQVASTAIGVQPDLSAITFNIHGGRAGVKLHRAMFQELGVVAAYEASQGRAFNYATAVADAYAISSAVTY